VEQIDAIVKPILGTRWQESQPGDSEVRRQLRLVLNNNGLPRRASCTTAPTLTSASTSDLEMGSLGTRDEPPHDECVVSA
jgi:hypothetical protein